MTYTKLNFGSPKSYTQVYSTGERLFNTVLQSRLKKLVGFLIKQHYLSSFAENFSLKKNKMDGTETT